MEIVQARIATVDSQEVWVSESHMLSFLLKLPFFFSQLVWGKALSGMIVLLQFCRSNLWGLSSSTIVENVFEL